MIYGAQNEYRPWKTLLLHRPQPEDLLWVREDTLTYVSLDPVQWAGKLEVVVFQFPP